LIYLFSNEGLPHLTKLVQACLPPKTKEERKSDLIQFGAAADNRVDEIIWDEGPAPAHMSIEVFNVIVCLNLMSMCCEGKSDLAESKCQKEIINLHSALTLYRESGRLWPLKCTILKYIAHCYLDSGNPKLFSSAHPGSNLGSLKEIMELVSADMVCIHEEWHNSEQDCRLIMPDGTQSTFSHESKVCALEYVTHFFKAFLKNKRIDLGVDMFPVFHDITARIAKMFYETSSENFKDRAMDVLSFIN